MINASGTITSMPKIIHYCWFGESELPNIAVYCIASWKKYCPDYEIICWDESNSDLESCLFIKEAYAEKKWAFVSDYIRLKAVEKYGGIYLDIDVELLKSLDDFLTFDGFMGFEQNESYYVATGLGFGAKKNHPVVKLLMLEYENSDFIKSDGSLDQTTCPIRDTKVLKKLGLVTNNKKQFIDGICIFPAEYFCPISSLGLEAFTSNTVSIHHFNGSWIPKKRKKIITRKKLLIKKFGFKFGILINYLFTALDEIYESGWKSFLKRSLKFLIHSTHNN